MVGLVNLRKIPSSGETIGLIGCGTYRGFDVTSGTKAAAPLDSVVTTLLDGGGSILDSSPMYGRAEDTTGEIVQRLGRRTETFLATKVWTSGKQAGIAQMRTSLKLLRTPYVDLMQVHNLLDVQTHLETLGRWKADGLTRYVGITHYHRGAFADLERVMRSHSIDFVQFNYSLEDRAAEDRLLSTATEKGIAVLINLPFGGGSLLKKLSRDPLPPFAAEIGCSTWSQFLLKFVLGHEAVTCAIPGTGNPAHMAENIAAAEGDLVQARAQIQKWWLSR
jgi:diketogulonate reductase-like aldo/keto reductase